MLNFTIFGIPVSVDPWFWLMAFFMGNGFYHLKDGSMIYVLVWMVILFVSILVHELGHALVGHKLGGGRTWIKLWAFGGLAYHQAARFTRNGRRTMILAGPGAGLCLFFITCGLIMLTWPGSNGWEMIKYLIGFDGAYPVFFAEDRMKVFIFRQMIWVNLWWSLVNLLPIFPLDGGQYLETFMKSPKRLHLIGMITAVGFIVFALSVMGQGGLFIPMMFGYFAFMNYQAYEKAQY